MNHNIEEQAHPSKEEGTEQLMAKIFAFENNDTKEGKKDDKFADLNTIRDIEIRLEANK